MTTSPDWSQITAAGLAAFQKLAAPFTRIIEGQGTIQDDEQAANAVMDLVALMDPLQALTIAEIEAAEPFVNWLLANWKSGNIGPGISPSWHPGPDDIHHR